MFQRKPKKPEPTYEERLAALKEARALIATPFQVPDHVAMTELADYLRGVK